MAKGIKTGGRAKGTPNKLTTELRISLKNILADEIKDIPKILKDLEPKDRLELIIKLMTFALPKVQAVNYYNGEPIENNWNDL